MRTEPSYMISPPSLQPSPRQPSNMSPTLRPNSPPQSATTTLQRATGVGGRPSPSSRKQNHPHFHLSNLPRFHPAVYQSPSTTSTSQPPSSPLHQQRPAQPSRMPSGSRDALRQYRDLIAGVALTPRSSATSVSSSSRPSKPRLDPLGSPGPVTPLALEEEGGGYLSAGLAQTSSTDNGLSPDELVQKLVQREKERMAN